MIGEFAFVGRRLPTSFDGWELGCAAIGGAGVGGGGGTAGSGGVLEIRTRRRIADWCSHMATNMGHQMATVTMKMIRNL